MRKCVSCSTEFKCTANKDCWCTSYPTISWTNPGPNCYCSDCLIIAMAQKVNASPILPDKETKAQIKALEMPVKLRDKVDYTLNEEGLMILSRWFLLRRGHCCKNGCRHCPYGIEHSA